MRIRAGNEKEELKKECKALNEIAYFLYTKCENEWDLKMYMFNKFNDRELAELWAMCIYTPEHPLGKCYDDEVYETIYDRESKDEIFKEAHYIAEVAMKGENE